eukprot:g4119.t1
MKALLAASGAAAEGEGASSLWKKLRENRQQAVDVEKQHLAFRELQELLAGVWTCQSCLRRNWREHRTCQQCGRPRQAGRHCREQFSEAKRPRGRAQMIVANSPSRFMMDGLPSAGFEPCSEADAAPARAMAHRASAKQDKRKGARMFYLHIPDEDRGGEYGATRRVAVANAHHARCALCRHGGAEAAELGLRPSTHTCRQILTHTGGEWTDERLDELAASQEAHVAAACRARMPEYEFGESAGYRGGGYGGSGGSAGGPLLSAAAQALALSPPASRQRRRRGAAQGTGAEAGAGGARVRPVKMEGQSTESAINRKMVKLQGYRYPMESNRARAEERMQYYRSTMNLPRD